MLRCHVCVRVCVYVCVRVCVKVRVRNEYVRQKQTHLS